MAISRERAERIARAHACVSCGEYSYRKITIREASSALRAEFGEAWHATLLCGVCGAHQELGIDDDGDVAYVT
jgi:transcription elongation factor Elf1